MATLSLKEYYLDLNSGASKIIASVCDDQALLSRQSRSHNHLTEYLALGSAVGARPEAALLDFAAQEYQYALNALVSGWYRHAFVSLRLTLELALAAVSYSAQEIKFRRWAAGQADINWASLVDNEEGVFSKNFIKAFSPSFADNGAQYRAIAASTYRECSEFVHGNWKTHEQMGTNLHFKEKIFLSWHDLADSAHLAIVFAFAARFGGYLEEDKLLELQPILADTVGELPAVQALFG